MVVQKLQNEDQKHGTEGYANAILDAISGDKIEAVMSLRSFLSRSIYSYYKWQYLATTMFITGSYMKNRWKHTYMHTPPLRLTF